VEKEPSGLRGQCPKAGLWLLTATLPTSSSSSELLAEKSGLGGCHIEDCHKGGCGSSSSVFSEAEYFSSLLSESIMISCIWFGDSRQAQEIARSIDENCSATTGRNRKLSTDISRNFCKAVRDNAPSPYLTTDTQLHVTKIT